MNLQAYSDYNDRAKDLNSNLSVVEDFEIIFLKILIIIFNQIILLKLLMN